MTNTEDNAQEGRNFGILHQYTKDLSFENLITAKEMLQNDYTPTGEIGFSVNAEKIDDTVHEIVIKIRIDAKDEEQKKSVYILELEYAGLVHAEGFPEEELVPLLMVEVPRLIFPFARAVVSDATRDGGFLPLVLKPVDFLGLFLEQNGAGEEPTN